MTTEEASTQPDTVPTGVQLTAIDPTFREDPYPGLAKLRERDPMHHDTSAPGFSIYSVNPQDGGQVDTP